MDISQYENYQEKEIPADPLFPYQTYLCSIPLDFSAVPLHWHDEMEIIYIKKGSGCVSVDFDSYQVKGRDIVLVLPGRLHGIGRRAAETMEYENIIFRLSLLHPRQPDAVMEHYLAPLSQRQLALPVHITPDRDEYPQIAACLDSIDRIRQTFPPGFELYIKGKLFELFYILFSACATPAAGHPAGQNRMDKTRQILKYIEQHYPEKLSIQTMAAVSGFSQSHFMKFFKSALGTSFTAYLNDYRLTMASRLLLASGDSILHIAADTGFDNLSYFNRMFKKKFGTTPSGFRKMH